MVPRLQLLPYNLLFQHLPVLPLDLSNLQPHIHRFSKRPIHLPFHLQPLPHIFFLLPPDALLQAHLLHKNPFPFFHQVLSLLILPYLLVVPVSLLSSPV